MKKITLSLSLCTLLVSAFAAGQNQTFNPTFSQEPMTMQSIAWQDNYDQAVAAAKASNKPILILFTGSTWCPACIKLEKEVLTHPEFARALSERVVFLKANFPRHSADSMAQSPFQELLERYHVNSFPTMIVTTADGRQLFQVDYRAGSVNNYVQEFQQKLNQLGR